MKKIILTMLALGISALVPVINAAETSAPATTPAAAPALTPGKWTADYKAAAAAAKAENKLLLLDFTGSDWCGWCMKLDDEVFSTSAFKKYAKENLVLVTVDFPHSKKLPAATKTQNSELQKKYGIRGYPTIIVLDSNEKPIGKLGYMQGGPKAFIAALDKIKARAGNAQENAQDATVKAQAGEQRTGRKGPASTLPPDVKPPRPDPSTLMASKPKYPSSMKNSGVAGEVVVEYVVDTDGKVRSAKIISSNNRNFEQPALNSVSKVKYTPGMRDGKPVKIIEQAAFHFSPEGGVRLESHPVKVDE